MYTQSFNVPDQAGQKTVAVTPSTEDAELMARFDARIDADGRIEPPSSHKHINHDSRCAHNCPARRTGPG